MTLGTINWPIELVLKRKIPTYTFFLVLSCKQKVQTAEILGFEKIFLKKQTLLK